MTNKISKFVRTFREEGPKRAFARFQSYWVSRENRRLEREFDLDVEEKRTLDDLTIRGTFGSSGFYYGATPSRVIRACLSSLGRDFEHETFVDIGSGKGLALLLASRFNFKRIIGIEFAKELHDIAEMNISKFRCPRQVCRSVESIWCDATEFDYPQSDCVVYLCNPFSQEVMHEVISRIRTTQQTHGNRITIIFHQLVHEDDTSRVDRMEHVIGSTPGLVSRTFRYRSPIDRMLLSHTKTSIFEFERNA